MSKAKLKEGVVVRPHGPASEITNKELDNDVATYLLESGSAKETDFEVLPPGYKAAAKKETAANTAGKKDDNTPPVKNLVPARSKEEIQKDLLEFNAEAKDADAKARQLVKELKLTPTGNKKAEVVAAVVEAQAKAKAGTGA